VGVFIVFSVGFAEIGMFGQFVGLFFTRDNLVEGRMNWDRS